MDIQVRAGKPPIATNINGRRPGGLMNVVRQLSPGQWVEVEGRKHKTAVCTAYAIRRETGKPVWCYRSTKGGFIILNGGPKASRKSGGAS